MPNLTDYFRRVTKIEGAALAMAEDVLSKVTLEEFMDDPDAVVVIIKLALRQRFDAYAVEAAAVGRSFATGIVAAVGKADPALAVQEGIAQMERAIDAAVNAFMLAATTQLEMQIAAGITAPTVNPGAFDTMQKRAAEAAENAVQGTSNAAIIDTILDDPTERWTWITVRDNRVCEDCGPRHKQTKPVAQWIAEGLPKSGFGVCGDRCRCVLLPEAYVDDSVDLSQPVRMSRADLAQFS